MEREETMTKKLQAFGLAGLTVLLLIPGLWAQANPYHKYLTAADIEKVTGLTGVKEVPRNPQKGAGGNLNFADGDGNLILIASFLTAGDFKAYKSEEDMVKETVEGVGEEAFFGPGSSDPPYLLLIRKGDRCLALSTFVSDADPLKTRIPMPQLIAIGKIVIGRM
jgi:hypothetical protein